MSLAELALIVASLLPAGQAATIGDCTDSGCIVTTAADTYLLDRDDSGRYYLTTKGN